MNEEQIQYVAPEKIACDQQVRTRFDEEQGLGLLQSIKTIGIQHPLRVRRDGERFVVVDGERRLRAARKAGLALVPVIVDERELSEADTMTRQLILNCQRQELSPLETAVAIGRLMKETGWSASRVATTLGFSNATVSRLLALTGLPDDIRDKVAAGAIPASAAYELSHIDDAAVQADLARQVEAGALKRDAIRGAARGERRRRDRKSRASRLTARVTEGLSVTVKSSSLTLDDLIRWLEVLVARAREAQPRGTDMAGFLKSITTGARE